MSVDFRLCGLEATAGGRTTSVEFSPGLTVVHGPVGTGKGVLMQLVCLGLGQHVDRGHAEREITRLVMELTVGGRHVTTQWRAGRSQDRLEMTVDQGRTKAFAIGDSGDDAAGRQWLEMLGLSALADHKVGTSRGFAAVWKLCHLRQGDTATSVAGHVRPRAGASGAGPDGERRHLIRHVLGLADERTAAAQLEQKDLLRRRKRLRRRVDEARRQLSALGHPYDPPGVLPGAASDARLGELRAAAQAAREAVGALAHELASLKARRAGVGRGLEGVSADGPGAGAPAALCPACRGVLPRRAPHLCAVCGRPHAARSGAPAGAGPDGGGPAVPCPEGEVLAAECGRLGGELARARVRADEAERLLAEAHGLRARYGQVSKLLGQVTADRIAAAALDGPIQAVADELEVLAADLGRGAHRLSDLDSTYRDLMADVGVDWQGEASLLEEHAFVPHVGSLPFHELSHEGGRNVVANVLFYLALHRVSMSEPAVRLPSLVMLDSPRNALGQADTDLDTSRRMYRHIVSMLDAAPQKAPQVVVNDNDLRGLGGTAPEGTTYIELSPESRLLDGVRPAGSPAPG